MGLAHKEALYQLSSTFDLLETFIMLQVFLFCRDSRPSQLTGQLSFYLLFL